MGIDNPNPAKYVIKMRKGRPILVSRQILRWRKRRAKLAKAEAKKAATLAASAVVDKRDVLRNIFE